jgi:fructosamine-3-kinase
MWTEIAHQISQMIGQSFTIDKRFAVSGGSINQTYCLVGNRHSNSLKYLIKLNLAGKVAMFEAEAIALQQIQNTATIRVPKPIGWGVVENSAFLILEWLELCSDRNWANLGKNLAALHRVGSDRAYGWHQNNTIGTTPQINSWCEDWSEFWQKYRLGYQLQLAKRKGFSAEIGDRLLAKVPEFFSDYQPQPSLVHGDLWSGNFGFVRNEMGIEPVIFDPACYFGDREVDIAMTELFGGFAPEFYQAYKSVLPLDSGYEQRQHLYNSYHLLNHFNLFGGSYAIQAEQAIAAAISKL